MSIKHFLTLDSLNRKELEAIINRALELKAQTKRRKFEATLNNRVLGMIFEKSSTRTRVSFEAGMAQQGGHAIFLSSRDTQLGRGEPIEEDTAKVISSMVDCIVIRTHDHNDVLKFSAKSSVPVINGLSDLSHPCQTLATLMTITEIKGTLENINISWFGPISNVAHSLIDAANKNLGFNLNIYCPKYYQDVYFQKLKDMNKEIS